MSAYAKVYDGWKADPEAFWMEAAAGIDWFEKPSKAFFEDQGVYGHWYADGTLNTCYNCVDRHVEGGRADQAAIIYDSPITGNRRTFTYARIEGRGRSLAAVLRGNGIEKGDRVIIYMPMVPEARCDARLRALGRDSFRRFWRFAALNSRHASTIAQPKVHHFRLLRHRARAGRLPINRCSTRPSIWQSHKVERASSCSASSRLRSDRGP